MRERLLVALALVFLAAFLWPTLAMPYLGDDTFNAYLDGWIGFEHLSLGSALAKFYNETGFGVGRFDPIFPLIVFFNYHVVHALGAIKALVLITILINAFSVYVLVRTIAPRLALPTLIVLPAVLQIRYSHDPIIQFSLHMQVAFECFVLAAIALAAFARTQHRGYALASVVAYAGAALTYEATYALFIPLGALAFGLLPRGRARVLLFAAYAAVPIGLSAFVVALRAHAPVEASSQYAISFAPLAMLRVVWFQAFGALPLSYSLSNPDAFLPSFVAMWRTSPSMWVTACVAFVLFGTALARKRTGSSASSQAAIIVFAVVLVFASAAMISLSPRWQSELRPGLAYVPVYFAVFGVAIVLAALLELLARSRLGYAGTAGAAAIVAILVGTTYRTNALALAHFAPWSMVVPSAIDAGILAGAKTGATIYLDDSYPAHARDESGTWNARYYLFEHARARLDPAHLGGLPAAPRAGSFALVGDVAGFDSGRVVAGPIAAVAHESSGNVALVTSAVTFDATAAGSRFRSWTTACGPLPIANVLARAPTALLIRYDASFSVIERDGAIPFRWSSGHGNLLLDNPTGSDRRATLTFSMRPAGAAKHVRYHDGEHEVDRESSGADVDAVSRVVVRAHQTLALPVDSDNAPIANDPAGRVLRFQIRDAKVSEAVCAV